MQERDGRQFCTTVAELRERHGARLAGLLGKRIDAAWVAWNVEEDRWSSLAPLVLRVGGQSLDLVVDAAKVWLDSGSIDLDGPVDARLDEEDYVVAWKPAAHPALLAACGRTVSAVYALEFRARVRSAGAPADAPPAEAWWLGGLGFELDGDGVLELASHVDENLLSSERSHGDRVRVTPLVPAPG